MCAIAALEALRTLVDKGADVQLLLPPILNALQDSDSCVREAALEALRTLVEKGADVQVLLPPILNALQDSDWRVRRAALRALPTLVEKGADVQLLLPPILNALKDSHSSVHEAALQALRTLVEKGADVQLLLPPILNALQDSYSYVHRGALEALGQVSTELLTHYYWETKDRSCVTALIPRLYEVALTVEDVKESNRQRLVLHSGVKDSGKWKKSKEEMQSFRKHILESRLRIAAENGHLELVECLVRQGAPIGTPDNNEITPLYLSVKSCHLEVGKYLLKQGAGADTPAKPKVAHNLACLYNMVAIEAKQEGQEQEAQEYLAKAKDTFELAVETNDPPKAGLCTEYANFLITTGELEQAYQYLQKAITSGNDGSGLGYRPAERETVAPILRERIGPDGRISLRPIDYAYYLLIHHYADFQKAGVDPDKTREAYLQDYEQTISDRANRTGEEIEIARYLLEKLKEELNQADAG